MLTPIIRDKEAKLDFAVEAAFSAFIAGLVITPILHTFFVRKYYFLFDALVNTVHQMLDFLGTGFYKFIFGTLLFRFFIYHLIYADLDNNEKTSNTMVGGSLIIIMIVVYTFATGQLSYPYTYTFQTFVFCVSPMLVAFNSYVWYSNIWGASNAYTSNNKDIFF